MKNPYLIFTAVVALLFTFFYFYEVDLFEAQLSANNETFKREISFKTLLSGKTENGNYAIKPTLQGWMILGAIFIGLPTMIAYRVTLKRYPRRAREVDEK